MDQCFSCKKFKDLTVEHVIPQALGGRLKAKLYCKECNNTFGYELDDILTKNFGHIGTLLNIKRERGKPQPFNVNATATKTKLVFTGRSLTRKSPNVIIKSKDGKKLEFADVTARSKEELERIKASIQEKYEISNEAKQKTFQEIHPGPTDTNFEIRIDGKLIRRAISKIAYSFLCIKVSKDLIFSSAFDKIRKYIEDGSEPDLASANYLHTKFMTDYNRPLHKIHVALNRNKLIVVGFVTLFGIYRFSILLSDIFVSHFEWAGLDYTFDPVRLQEVPGNNKFQIPPLNKSNILNPKQSENFVLSELGKGYKVLENYVDNYEFIRNEFHQI